MSHLIRVANKFSTKLNKIANENKVQKVLDLFNLAKQLSTQVANASHAVDAVSSTGIESLVKTANFLEGLCKNLANKARAGTLTLGFASISKQQILDKTNELTAGLSAAQSAPNFSAIQALTEQIAFYANDYVPEAISLKASKEVMSAFLTNSNVTSRFLEKGFGASESDAWAIANMFIKYYPSLANDPSQINALLNDPGVVRSKLNPIIDWVTAHMGAGAKASPASIRMPANVTYPNVAKPSYPETPELVPTRPRQQITLDESGKVVLPTP